MPGAPPAWLLWTAGLVLLLVAYEILRALLLAAFQRRLRRSVDRSIREKGIRLDRFKFTQGFLIRDEILNDVEINAAIVQRAGETGRRVDEVREEAEAYIEEIVPAFSLVSYYRFGASVARLFMNWLYSVVVNAAPEHPREKVPEDAALVYIANHRSNVDYVAIAYTLIDEISLSYATGEWARVWPLESLFKSFGAYFVRRGYPDPLYHLILEKYVQIITRHGVTQGIFLEGGLSRDGLLRAPKIGILDYLLKMKGDGSMTRDLVLVPVGINYDRVLEDEVLLKESETGGEKSGFRANLRSFVRIFLGAPWILGVNITRALRGYKHRHGYAGVSFGDPVSADAWLRSLGEDIFSLEKRERRKRIKAFADLLMERIAKSVPVTPVPLVSHLLLQRGEKGVGRTALLQDLVAARRHLIAVGAPVVMGDEFAASRLGREHLARERETRLQDLVSFEETFLDIEEARDTLQIALGILGRRKLVRVQGDWIRINPARRNLLAYYARSIGHHLEAPPSAASREGTR